MVKLAVLLALGLLTLAVGDMLGWRWVNEIGDQPVATTLVAEAVLLLIVSFVVDAAAERRARKAQLADDLAHPAS